MNSIAKHSFVSRLERERGLLKSLRDTGTDCISNDYKIASVKTEVHFFAPSDVTQLMFNNNYL